MNRKSEFFYSICLAFLMMVSQQVMAQSPAYTVHTIKAGETLSAIAKKYGTTVGNIMRLNGMNTKSILKLGEQVKIPKAGKAIPANTAAAVEKTTPPTTAIVTTPKPDVSSAAPAFTYTVQKGESLYRISKINHVSVDKIKELNHLTSNDIKVGQVLVLSGAPSSITQAPATQQPKIADAAPATKTEPSITQKEAPAVTKPEEKTADTSLNIITTPAQQTQPTVTQEKPVVVEEKPAVTVAPPVTQTAPASSQTKNTTADASLSGEGFFTSQFGVDVEGRSLQTTSGTAMVFKTASGWADKKYYVLMNNVPPGSIVKISYNDKVVYAKVLWSLGSMKENEGLNFRISNAAASALGVNELKFNLSVTYYE